MSIKVIVELQIKENKLKHVRPLFAKLLPETRNRNGNEGVIVFSDQDTPTTIVLIEQWVSRRDYEEYNQWRAERGDHTRLAELLTQPPQRRYFDYVTV